MIRLKKIGYLHAALATIWFSIAANDTSDVVNGFLGDAGCTMISWVFAFPLTWLAALVIGFPLFPSMPEHFIRMSLMGAIVVVNGLVVGYCLDWVLTRAGVPDRSRLALKSRQV